MNEAINIVFGTGLCDTLCSFDVDIFKIEIPKSRSAVTPGS